MGWSVELCGGTHVRRTGDIGLITLTGESAVASGVRRIEALTGNYARRHANETMALAKTAASELRTSIDDVPARITALMEERKKLERELSDARKKLAMGGGASAGNGAASGVREAGGVGRGERMGGEDLAREQRADKRAHAPKDESDQSLRGTADARVGLVVDVELSGDEEEIVARAVQQNRGEDERRLRRARLDAEADREVAQHPAQDADEDRELVAEAAQEKRQQQKEDHVRYLGERGLLQHMRPLELRQVDTEVHEIEVEGDADEKHAHDEDRERRFL